ncbi:MAG: thioesterase family protein [Acidimicrobiia bacterium]
MTSAYYELIDGLLHPTDLSVGPWTPNVQHGAAVCGAVTRAVEALPTAQPMDIVRQATDLSRGVPMGPTRVDTRVLREGKRLQVVEADIIVGGEIYARANVLRMRRSPVIDDADRPAPWPGEAEAGARPEVNAHPELWNGPLAMSLQPMWERWQPGRGAVWIKMTSELVAGEPLTPPLRASLSAEMIMTSGHAVSLDRYIVINADISMSLTRMPIGDDIRVTSTVRLSDDGYGVSEGELYDTTGRFGSGLKSLLIDRRRPDQPRIDTMN